MKIFLKQKHSLFVICKPDTTFAVDYEIRHFDVYVDIMSVVRLITQAVSAHCVSLLRS